MTRVRLTTTIISLALCFGGASLPASAQTRGRTRQAPPTATKKAEAAADAPAYPLSDEQQTAIRSILSKSKLEGAPLALLGAQAAKEFDENILAEAPDAAADEGATKRLLNSLDGVAKLRLQTIREVVALLTPEQKRVLRAEMAKPGTPTSLLDVLARVFKLPPD